MFTTVLVANRGEIALRVIKTLRRMGIRSVAVYSDADAHSPHVAAADLAVRLGPAPARASYLDIERVVAAAVASGAEAVHPGYGFLSENSAFAATLAERGITFIGPSAHAIAVMGDKITARNTVVTHGVPVVPGISRPGLSDAELIAAVPEIGFPVLIKPSAGGGGKGMRVVASQAELPAALASSRREARGAFGDDTLFLERFVTKPRHIEVQVLADQHGRVLHLGERECSLQRRHQKLVEEAPSPAIDAATRERLGAAACAAARSVDYSGAGTVEFIVSGDRPDEFSFMEMNTRLQVEHPVTEMITGLDLVEWQVRIAAGEPLDFEQSDVKFRGHAIEVRVYAEDPAKAFLPTGGRIEALNEPSGVGVRVDSGVAAGMEVSSHYDPMLAKVIVHQSDRSTALAKMDEALADYALLGVTTNVGFARQLLRDPDVVSGQLDTALVERVVEGYTSAPTSDALLLAAAAWRWSDLWLSRNGTRGDALWRRPTGWRLGDAAPVRMRLGSDSRDAHVSLCGDLQHAVATIDAADPRALSITRNGGNLELVIDGLHHSFAGATAGDWTWLAGGGVVTSIRELDEPRLRGQDHAHDGDVRSPMPGSVVVLAVSEGDSVKRGDLIAAVEAMKMEHALTAPIDGTVKLSVSLGEQVTGEQLIATVVAVNGDDQRN